MKKALAILLTLMLVVMGSAALAQSKTIAGVVFQEDQFMKMLSDGYAAAAKDLGYEILLANTNNDQSKESEIINTYVSQGIAGVAISPEQRHLPRSAGRCQRRGPARGDLQHPYRQLPLRGGQLLRR